MSAPMDVSQQSTTTTAGAYHGAHLSDQSKDASIESLPNEVLAAIIHEPTIAASTPMSALVCWRWRNVAHMHQEKERANMMGKHRLCASSVLSMIESRMPKEIRAVLESVMCGATVAHLLPVLVASNRPDLIDYAYDILSDTGRTIEDAEAAAWSAAHAQIEARFGALWPDHVCERMYLHCDHTSTDARSFAVCVLLSVAARHTCAPSVIARFTSQCRANERALHKAIFIAAASDRSDVMGALMYTYGQCLLHGNALNVNAIDMFQALNVIVGTHASLACARIVALFHSRGDVTPEMVMPPLWCNQLRCVRCTARLVHGGGCGKRCAFTDMKKILYSPLMRGTCWLWAAIAADRPEMLDMYFGLLGYDSSQSTLRHAARAGKPRFCRAIMAASPNTSMAVWCGAVNKLPSSAFFTLDGVRWLASQEWYSPQPAVLVCAIDDILHNKEARKGANHHAALARDAVDALGIMAAKWPTVANAGLLDQPRLIGLLLVSCITHDKDSEEKGNLLDVLTKHLECCDVVAAMPDSAMDRLWSYVTRLPNDGSRHNYEKRMGCHLCETTPMGVVFSHLLRRYEVAVPSTSPSYEKARKTVDLSLVPRTLARRMLYGHALADPDHAPLNEALSYLARNNLLTDD